MTKETLNGMTKKERLAIYKNGEKQTIHFMSIIRGSMIKKRAVVLGNLAVDNYGQVLELTNEKDAMYMVFQEHIILNGNIQY